MNYGGEPWLMTEPPGRSARSAWVQNIRNCTVEGTQALWCRTQQLPITATTDKMADRTRNFSSIANL